VAAAPGEARDALNRELVARQYENGQAMNMAATLEIDAVIDPAQTRPWLVRGLASARNAGHASGRYVDTW
jgi:acetyl-CoA carboxylase carboxyltransferase component